MLRNRTYRRMLDVLTGGTQDSGTRLSFAAGQRSLGGIRVRQGRMAEALPLMESARQTLVDLRSTGYSKPDLRAEMASTEQALARARVFVGDLDGALSSFQELLRITDPCDEHALSVAACRTLGVRLSWTADVYAAVDRPNLGEPEKAAVLYQQALEIQERIAAQDAQDRQAHFDLAARYGKLGDAVWRSDPRRAIELYGRARSTAQALASKEQLAILNDAYLIATMRPLVQLGRLTEARRAWTELAKEESSEPQPSAYADRLGEIDLHEELTRLLVAEGKRDEARRTHREADSGHGEIAHRKAHRPQSGLLLLQAQPRTRRSVERRAAPSGLSAQRGRLAFLVGHEFHAARRAARPCLCDPVNHS